MTVAKRLSEYLHSHADGMVRRRDGALDVMSLMRVALLFVVIGVAVFAASALMVVLTAPALALAIAFMSMSVCLFPEYLLFLIGHYLLPQWIR